MQTRLDPDEIRRRVIAEGRSHVRLLEAVAYLLPHGPAWTERGLLRLMGTLYRHRWCTLITELPPGWNAEILAASETIAGPVRQLTLN